MHDMSNSIADANQSTYLGGEVLKRGGLHNVDRERVVGINSRKATGHCCGSSGR